MDSTFASVCRLVAPSVFHFSMRVFARSDCMLCAVSFNCSTMLFSSLTDAYATGGCEPAASCLPAKGGATTTANPAMKMKQKSDRTRIFCEFDMGLRLGPLCFGNHILFDIDHARRD